MLFCDFIIPYFEATSLFLGSHHFNKYILYFGTGITWYWHFHLVCYKLLSSIYSSSFDSLRLMLLLPLYQRRTYFFWMNAFDFYSPQVKLVVGYIIKRNTSLCVFFSCKFFINKLIYKWKYRNRGEAIKKKSKVAFAVICVAVFFTDSFLYAYASGHET